MTPQGWYTRRQDTDPYLYPLKTTINVRPETLSVEEYGHHRSYGYQLQDGSYIRMWAFKEEVGRDLVYHRFRSEVIQ